VQVEDYWLATESSRRSVNVIGLILFCFVFGAIIASMGKNGKILADFFEALNEATVKMIQLVMK
jgi:Na+/H+-dicarboxylate symporter